MRRITLLASILAVIAISIGAISFGSSTVSAADDPEAALQALIDGFNEAIPSGDGAAAANAFTEDGFFTNTDDGFAIVGRHAMTVAFSQEADQAFHVTLISSEVDGNTITGSAEIADQGSVDAGVGSHIELFTLTAEESLVSSFVLSYDHSDADTVTYLEYQASQEPDPEEGEDEVPAGTVELEMTGDQPGHVFVGELEEGVGFISLDVTAGPAGVLQPAHVHTGTCDDPGGIVYPLAFVSAPEGAPGGGSFTILSASQEELLNSDYIANVHLSEAEPGTYVSCAALEGAAAATPTPGTGLPDTGTGASDDGSAVTWLIASLALVGIGGVAGASVLARRR